MANNIITREISKEILNKCFAVPAEGLKVKHLCYDTEVHPSTAPEYSYGYNNGKVAFVYGGTTYVAKGYSILKKLEEAGFENKGIFVPFSNGEWPLDPIFAEKWNSVPEV